MELRGLCYISVFWESLGVSVNFRLFTALIITVFIFFLINEVLLVNYSKLAGRRFDSFLLALNGEFSVHESFDRS